MINITVWLKVSSLDCSYQTKVSVFTYFVGANLNYSLPKTKLSYKKVPYQKVQ